MNSGSSPHTRGAPQLWRRPPCRPGIIPAYAGSTHRVSWSVFPQGDHPRIRGEHWGHGGPGRGPRGSSPHTRGALHARAGHRLVPRIIPAYAGSTTKTFSPPRAARDHPRIRGEHFTIEWEVKPGRGSSPHTRGALCRGATTGGSTRDHPRIRGEHCATSALRPSLSGSSPHTRGAPEREGGPPAAQGIIPAYAGSTRA